MLVAQNSLGPVCPVPLTVRGTYKWCGTNPCDWCSGCYKYDGTCDTTISGQANCFSSGQNSHGSMWCGADEGTCTGCPGCYKQSDTAGPVCDTNSFSTTGESACTANNHIDGVDNTWCGSASWPCYDSASGATCSGCYDLSLGSCGVTDAYQCVSPWVKWCGTNPCDSCSGCYSSIDGTCYGASQMMCITEGSQWCGADEGTCNGCEYCYTLSDTGGASRPRRGRRRPCAASRRAAPSSMRSSRRSG